MALNLKKEDNDRIVPNCSSDESGSDCSSEELIDCDVIVDVTTVTTQNDEDKKLKRFDEKEINDNTFDAKIDSKANDFKSFKRKHEDSNTRDDSSKLDAVKSVNENLDKSFPIISQTSDSKQSETKPNLPKHKKRRVNFNLTIDIAKPPLSRNRDSGEQCVPQCPPSFGGHGSTDFTDIESLSEPIPTTPGGKPQVDTLN